MKLLFKPFKTILAILLVVFFSCSNNDESIDSNNDESIENEDSGAVVVAFVPETKTIEIEILNLVNQHREELNLIRLENMSVVKAEAYKHTEYMIRKNELSHDNFDERADNLIINAGAVAISENVASGFNSPGLLVEAWLESESHRLTIEGDYTIFDISAEQDDEGKWYYTNIFIKN